MPLSAVGAFALLSLIGPAAPAAEPARGGFTLEQVMGAPFPSDLFLRIPSSPASREILRPHREGPPWSLCVADVASGRAREVFRADPGRGSVFRAIVALDQLIWADGDRIVFPWEKDGWTHLYAVSATGGPPALLTAGDFEVEHVSVTPDRKAILYGSNQDDIERRHLWRVAVAGGKPLALSKGTNLHGVHDWSDWFRIVAGDDIRGKDAAAARVAFESSPMADVKTWRSPVLLIHGDDDRNVPFQQSVVLAEALRERGVKVEPLVFPGEVHDFLVQAHWIEAFRAATDFLERNLNKK